MSKHIRPKIRSRRVPKATATATDATVNASEQVPSSSATGTSGVDDLLEQTRRQMSNALNISTNTAGTGTLPIPSPRDYLKQQGFIESAVPSRDTITTTPKETKGILKQNSRYQGTTQGTTSTVVDSNSNSNSNTAKQVQVHEQQRNSNGNRGMVAAADMGMASLSEELGLPETDLDAMTLDTTNMNGRHHGGTIQESCVKEFIVERKNPIADPFPTYDYDAYDDSLIIEGHLPKSLLVQQQENKGATTTSTSTKSNSTTIKEGVTFATGTSKPIEQMSETEIEANMEFSCMTREEYDESVQIAIATGVSVEDFLIQQQEARRNEETIVEEEDEDTCMLDGEESTSMTDIDTSEHDDFLEFFSGGIDDDDEEEEILPSPQLRPFMILWKAITTWMTGEAVEYAQNLSTNSVERNSILEKEHSKTNVISDVGLSRYKGLMSMLKFNLRKALDELGYNADDGFTRKTSEERLGKWVQFFNFAEPMGKLDSTLWRSLTAILLDIILPKHDLAYEGQSGLVVRIDEEDHDTERFPESAKDAGLTFEEYHYLAVSAIPSLSSSDLQEV
jgi:hypothetical protein